MPLPVTRAVTSARKPKLLAGVQQVDPPVPIAVPVTATELTVAVVSEPPEIAQYSVARATVAPTGMPVTDSAAEVLATASSRPDRLAPTTTTPPPRTVLSERAAIEPTTTSWTDSPRLTPSSASSPPQAAAEARIKARLAPRGALIPSSSRAPAARHKDSAG
jgi:hypothetical protein